MVVAFTPLWGTGPARQIWVAVLQGPTEHQCACSLAAGHHCRCPKCLEEAHHDEPRQTSQWAESDCEEDEDGEPTLVAQAKVLLPSPLAAPVRALLPLPVDSPEPSWQSRALPPPEPPPPNQLSA